MLVWTGGAQQRADVNAVRWCVRDGMTISLHLLPLGRGQGGRRRKGREGVVSVDPGYLWEIGSSTPSFHRGYQNLWVCTSAYSASLNIDWRLSLKLVLGHMDHRSYLKPQPYNRFG